jgi:FSR family fosmidomycin resistance protein-like MFS transporter
MEKIPLFIIFLGHIWVDASQGILPVVLPKLKELLDLNYFQVGLVMTVLNLTASVVQPVFGYIADRFRSGWFIPWGLIWTAVTMGMIGWAPGYISILILVGLAGLGAAAFHPRAMMAVFWVSGMRKGLGQAIFATGGNTGFALGPIVGSFLVLGFGIHATVGLVIPGVLLALVIIFYPGDSLRREATKSGGASELMTQATNPIDWVSLVLVCLIVTLRSWVYISFMTYLPMFWETQGIRLGKGSLLLTVFLGTGAAAGLYGGHLSDRLGSRGVIIVSMLLYPLFASLMLLGDGVWLWFLVAASGAALLCSFSVTVILAQGLLPGRLGLASGLILGLGFGTGGLGTALSGWMADVIGLTNAMWVLALAPVMSSLLAAFIKTQPPSRKP